MASIVFRVANNEHNVRYLSPAKKWIITRNGELWKVSFDTLYDALNKFINKIPINQDRSMVIGFETVSLKRDTEGYRVWFWEEQSEYCFNTKNNSEYFEYDDAKHTFVSQILQFYNWENGTNIKQ